MPRKIRLSEERTKAIVADIHDRWTMTQAEWTPWLENLPRWQKAYRGIVAPKTEPWPGCANLHVPVTAIGVERTHAALLGLTQQPEDIFEVMATGWASVAQAESVQEFLNWTASTELDLDAVLDRGSHKTCMYGRQAYIPVWRREKSTVHESRCVPVSELGGRTPRDAAEYEFQDRFREITLTDPMTARVRYVDQGRERTATLTVLLDEEREDPSEDELEYELEMERIKKDCPVIETPAPEDLLHTADSPEPEKAAMHFWSLWYSWPELRGLFRSGYYEGDDELLEALEKQNSEQNAAWTEQIASPNKAFGEQYGTVKTQSAMRRHKFHVLKVFCNYDLLDNGRDEEVILSIIWDEGGKGHILRAEYLHATFPHGLRPIIYSDWIYLDDIPVAVGIPEYIAALQAEINALRNQRLDADAIRNNPFFLYDKGSQLAPAIHRIRPGTGIPISNPAGVRFAEWAGTSASDVNSELQLHAMIERMLPVGDIPNGRDPAGRQTAAGTAMLIQQGREVWDKYLRRFGRAVGRIGYQAVQLYAANMEARRQFRVVGSDDLKEIDRDALRAEIDLRFRASMILAQKEVQRSYAMMRYTASLQDPFFQAPERAYAIREDWLKSQEVKDLKRLLGPRPQELSHPHLEPSQELELFLRGIPWEPHADEDFQVHLSEHHLQLESTTGKARQLLLEHIRHTNRLMSIGQQRAVQGGIANGGAEVTPDMGAAGGQVPLGNAMRELPGEVAAAGAPEGAFAT